jgi:YidC/Oxa1 family membrane protein insertase
MSASKTAKRSESSKVKEIHNPRRGLFDVRSFLLAAVVMACVYFGAQHVVSKASSAPVTATLSVPTSLPSHGGSSADRATQSPVGFGRWSVVAKPMLFLLTWVHGHVVSNWGWAIAILTIIINLALWPTRWLSLRSTLKMQRIQPRMETIKLRYKDCSLNDPRRQEMQREIVELQKNEGVNMFGGCLPALLPWPLLVGFYRMLAGAGVLRGAPWLWIRDLAAADPYHLLPVLVVVSMMATQVLTPTPGVNPSQQRVMAVGMALMMGVFAWKYAAGLALYFVCSNLFGAAQQLIMNQTRAGREIRRIAARRDAKGTAAISSLNMQSR